MDAARGVPIGSRGNRWLHFFGQISIRDKWFGLSALFEFGPGDRLEDAGRMVLSGGRFRRTEHFEVVRRAEDGWTLTSVTVGECDSYEGPTRAISPRITALQ